MTAPAFDSANSLKDHFLIAMPNLREPFFANSVVYVMQHNEAGAFGLVVNHPMQIQLDAVFEQLGIKDLRPVSALQSVLAGGPVEKEKGFVLHDAEPNWPSSMALKPGLTLTTSKEILEAIGHNDGPEHYLVALGCSGWNPGQLEKEITENSWFTCPASSDILFSTDFANKPNMAAATLGFTMAQLTSDVGYS
ncbi:MAG: YqgE/AlgH family protein [Gammaproteobacteria bacterium]|jgi:putative transcriptional regulator